MKWMILLPFCLFSCRPVLPIVNPFETPSPAIRPSSSATSSPLLIEVLDVGQGDSTLIVGPTGKAMLIDAGKAGEGIAAVLPALSQLGVARLDWIVATHFDADHIGGIGEVVSGPDQIPGTDDDFLPGSGFVDRGDVTDKSTVTYANYVGVVGMDRLEAMPGERFTLGGGASAEVVVVNGRYEDGRSIPLTPDEENEACIGLLIRYGRFRYFTAGDLTGGGSPGGFPTEDIETIVGEIIGDIDVLHIDHHGSESSSNLTFLEKTSPEAAVISVGADNDYGHPALSTLSRLESVGASIYRTDEMGTIEIQSDGEVYEINPLQ